MGGADAEGCGHQATRYLDLALCVTKDERRKILLVNQVHELRAAQKGQEQASFNLSNQRAEHSPGMIPVNQAGPDDESPTLLGAALNFQFGPAIKRSATFKGADRRNKDDLLHTRLPCCAQHHFAPSHVHCVNIPPAHEPEVVCAMNQRSHSSQRTAGNFLAEAKRKGTVARLRLTGEG